MTVEGGELPRGLYALIDDGLRPVAGLAALAAEVLEGGAKVLQLRLKHTGDREALALARQLVELRRRFPGAKVLINDRVDLALLSAADGVHLGDDDLPVAEARALLGARALIGATTRSLGEIHRAAAAGADHVGLGPVFATRTKHIPHPLLGPEGLRAICAVSPVPIVAIAGIGLSNIASVAAAGAHCAAVAGALLEGPSARAATAALVAEFSKI